AVSSASYLCFVLRRPPPISTLFPYTTLFRSDVGRAIVAVTLLDEDDLARFEPRVVEPLSLLYRGVEVLELPPPGQGVAALEGLGLLQGLEPTWANRIACARLALEDAFANVRDGADVSHLLDPAYLERRRGDVPSGA